MRSATELIQAKKAAEDISIHALLAERDKPTQQAARHHGHFNPRAPCGARRYVDFGLGWGDAFQSTRSLRSATTDPDADGGGRRISIHALLAERDNIIPLRLKPAQISIHALLAERDNDEDVPFYISGISIHALLAERDICSRLYFFTFVLFQSTRSLRSATAGDLQLRRSRVISIHALLAERDEIVRMVGRIPTEISIHALLAERD